MEYKARIEVATSSGSPSKEKGDLLERLAEDLLRITQVATDFVNSLVGGVSNPDL